MKKTHRLHPTYVEMDIHETKDHKFVVLHDENLKKLAGVNKTPHELTLAQLTRLTVHENGHHAKIASFDQYLNAAEKLHQKLLIEVKTTPTDSKGMLKRFNRQYGKRIIKDHDFTRLSRCCEIKAVESEVKGALYPTVQLFLSKERCRWVFNGIFHVKL